LVVPLEWHEIGLGREKLRRLVERREEKMQDLASFVKLLEQNGELMRIAEEVDPRFEVAAVTRMVAKDKGPALMFEKVKGYECPVLTNMLGTRKRIGFALNRHEKIYVLEGGKPLEPVLAEESPGQEVVIKDNIDLRGVVPVLTYHERDVSPYITQGIVFMKDLETGAQTMGVHRIQVRGKNRLGLYLASRTSTEFYRRAERRNEPLPVAVVIGSHPAVLLASVAWFPFGDKLSLAGGYLGEPLRMVLAKTVQVEVPAEAMFVIEGLVLPGVREPDGPFGESTGVYVPDITNSIEVTAITHRRRPIFSAFVPWTAEDGLVLSLAYGSLIGKELKRHLSYVKDVYYDFRCGGQLVVAVEEVARAETRRFLCHVMANNPYIKQVVAVNEDVDIFNGEEVTWAILTRSQPDRDWLILPDIPGSTIDPSTNDGTGAKVGIDATYPPDRKDRFVKIAPPAAAGARAREILRRLNWNHWPDKNH
jgi:2,5-furandicarboxylate decarboxylase 1